MPTDDRFDLSPTSPTTDQTEAEEPDRTLPYRRDSGRRPNAFGCLLLLTGALFAVLAVLGLRAYAHIAAADVVSLAMIGFVGILAVGQLIVGVWMLRGSTSDSGLP